MFDPTMLSQLVNKVPQAIGAAVVPEVAGPAPDASSWATTTQSAGADGSMGPFQAVNPGGFIDAFKGNLQRGVADKSDSGVGSQLAKAMTPSSPSPTSGGGGPVPDPAAGQQAQQQMTLQALQDMLPQKAPFAQASFAQQMPLLQRRQIFQGGQ